MDKSSTNITQITYDNSIQYKRITSVNKRSVVVKEDQLIIEEPLEIKIAINHNRSKKIHDLSVTMRTPGDDFHLVKGFLYTEGIISSEHDIIKMNYTDTLSGKQGNSILVHLSHRIKFRPEEMQRHFYTTSSCGVCGKTSIDMVKQQSPFLMDLNNSAVERSTLHTMLHRFSESQPLFSQTGGNHAAAAFDADGTILHLAEDVGRHNAFDKLIGYLVSQKKIPLRSGCVMVSGRASFELVQKSWMAGIPIFAAIGAPSSLAVELASDTGITLIGFLSHERMNIYTYADRIKTEISIE